MNGLGMHQTAASTASNIGKGSEYNQLLGKNQMNVVSNTFSNPFFSQPTQNNHQTRHGV